MDNVIEKLDMSLSKGIVKAVSDYIPKDRENIYALIQLG